MNILDEVKILNENKLLRTNEEIEKFECAIENILSNEDYKDIKHLCTGFDDNTEDDEVMFGIIHAIESYDRMADMKLTLKEFIDSIPSVYSYAKEWIKIMNKRILNDENSLEEYIKIAENCDTELKLILIELMNEVKKDNPERFSQPVNKFLTYVK
ncbi:Imm30 family immunity protein [Clostridium butyricum]|uniref:Imm30 family immunity protein n=1 Tax=Clostridium butyricum TaxID=1492 RepID=UPI0018A9D6AD|nr:Imm30 family immunity protein [Clostridium butyricum]